uniref:G domain-containing protein n=1 Tax=Globodera rostochiensis TaxID=31243 RepID=A0A914IDR4_GLORO
MEMNITSAVLLYSTTNCPPFAGTTFCPAHSNECKSGHLLNVHIFRCVQMSKRRLMLITTITNCIGPVNDSFRNDQLSQQLQPTTIARRPTGKKNCLATVEVEQKGKLTCRLKYAFIVTEAETFSDYGDEHCNPTVGHMMRTLLPKHLAMPMEQLATQFELQLQRLDNDFEPAQFIDIDPREWGAEWVKDRGEYNVLLRQKLDNNNDRTDARNQLNDARQMNYKGILNILLLGESCVGKSTLINALVNYLKHPTFEDAIQAGKIEWVIPAKFNTEEYDDDLRMEVKLGEPSEDELLEFGKLHTKRPKAYIIHLKGGHKIRLIDTPGIGGTDGEIKEDNENFHKTLNFISTLPELHAVCILLQSNRTRLTTQFKYCLNGLFTHLHKNAAQNIVFMSTFGRGAFYKMGETRELLQEILNPIEAAHNLSIPLHRNRIYCVDNEAFKHLCLIKKANVQYSEKEMDNISESWSLADQELQRLFKYIPKLKPHRTWETVSLNEARRIIVDLAPALADISEAIQDNFINERKMFGDKCILNTLAKDKRQMLHERALIYSKAAPFCCFLKKWALKPYNDSAEPYIKPFIQLENQMAELSNGAAVHEFHTKKLKGLEESLRLYREQKELMENSKADDTNTPDEVTAADVNKVLEELCELPMFGKSIRQAYEKRQKAREHHQKACTAGEETVGIGLFMPKLSKNGTASLRSD